MAYEVTIPPGQAPAPVDGPTLAELFPGGGYVPRARDGLRAILEREVSGAEAEVAILTTSGSRYVSACVTDTIESVCRHARQVGPRTELALVIHEWGFPHPDPGGLAARCRAAGIPLVEDSAYGIGSALGPRSVGNHGDYHLFSLPKYFALEGGGIVLGPGARLGAPLPDMRVEDPHAVAERRVELWAACEERLGPSPRWRRGPETVPGVFLLPAVELEGVFVRDWLRAAGIEAGFWFGNEHMFLPCHQRLTAGDVERVGQAIEAGREAWRERAAG